VHTEQLILAGGAVAAFLALLVLLPWLARRKLRRVARRVLAIRMERWATPHERAPVSLDAFPTLDRAFYDEATRALAAEGFTTLGDFENLSITRQNAALRTCIRTFEDATGSVAALVYHVNVEGTRVARRFPAHQKTFELHSELSDGHWVLTSNAPETSHFTAPAVFDQLRLERATPLARLLASHRERLAKYLAAHPGAKPLPAATLEGIFARGERQRLLRHEHHEKIGGITRDELRGILGPAREYLADAVFVEIEKEVRERASR
jgi:hypothetical protein